MKPQRLIPVLPLLLTSTLAAQAPGQPPVAQPPGSQGPTTSGMVLKGKAPVSSDVLKVKLPRPQTATLANGLQIMVVEDRTVPQINFQLIIPGAGGYHDPADRIGLAQVTAQMMREGTKTRNTVQIAQELETIAASVTVGSGLSSQTSTIAGGSLTENFDKVFAVAADILLNPTFPAEEWERARTRAKSGLVQQRANPGFLSTERYNRILYGDHPAGRVTMTAAGLDAITRDAMVEFHRTRYVPDHALIAFAGDISLADARKRVEAALGGWTKAGVPKPSIAEPPAPGSPKVTLIARPGSVQTLLRVGGPSMTRLDPDYEELTVANRVLGGTMGRLFRHLREEKGYTYGIGSSFSAGQHRGDWSASTSVRTAVTEAALTDLLAELAEMREKPVPAGEFEDAKRALQASFALSLENPAAILNYYVQSWTFGLPADYWDTFPARIAAVTADQAQAAARKYWDPARLHIVAVGDAPAISDALAKRGTLEVFDADGKPLTPGREAPASASAAEPPSRPDGAVPESSSSAPQAQPPAPVRLGFNSKIPTKIRDARPVYPKEALDARVAGMVILDAEIDAQGHVRYARVLRSIPLLDQAAIDAVKQWRYTPTVLDGVPVPVVMVVTVNFLLQ